MNKVVLIGCGNVGMSYAYSIINSDSKVDELVIIDVNVDKARGEAMDLMHASSCSKRKINIKAGDYTDCDDADIICISAGRNQDVGETRMDLIEKNYNVFKSIISEINKTKFNGIYLIATNPLDVMTYVTLKLSNFPAYKVIGSGTTLDTARLRFLISEQLEMNPKNIHAYVIGEHGDSEMIPWSVARIGLNSVDKYLNKSTKNKMLKDVRNSAYEIIKKKGNTAYGIGMCLKNITEAIFNNSNTIFTLSTYIDKFKCCVGYPVIVNRSGVRGDTELNLTSEEHSEFNKSLDTIKSIIKQIKF